MTDLHHQAQTGILPDKHLHEAVRQGVIHSEFTIPQQSYQPASLDLRLGETAYSLQCSFLPHSETIQAKLPQLTIAEIDIRDGAVLERNRPYLIPLLEHLNLPPDLNAKTNPKSSTGRLDIFTRVITDNNQRFDTIPAGYNGPMYIEVFSRSFTIKVATRLSLNQLRLIKGDPSCRPGEILEVHNTTPISFPTTDAPNTDNTLDLTLHLSSPITPRRIPRQEEQRPPQPPEDLPLPPLRLLGTHFPGRRPDHHPRTRGVLPLLISRARGDTPTVRRRNEPLPDLHRRAQDALRGLL